MRVAPTGHAELEMEVGGRIYTLDHVLDASHLQYTVQVVPGNEARRDGKSYGEKTLFR